MRALSRGAMSTWRAPLLALIGGGAVAVGSWLPWMTYFAGLVPLRGWIGLNGRLLLAASALGLVVAAALAPRRGTRTRGYARGVAAVLGVAVVVAAAWLLLGVWQLTHVHGMNAMMAPRPGFGLVVVLAGGAMLCASAWRAKDARLSSLSQHGEL
jgi:hypothetical protein